MSLLQPFAIIVVGCAMLAAAPARSAAQDIGTLPVPLVELSAGYAFMRDTSSEQRYPRGWYVSGGVNLNQWFGIVGEVGGSHRSDDASFMDVRGAITLAENAQIYTFIGGPRFFHKVGRIVPFGQLLVGAADQRLEQTVTRSEEGPGTGAWKMSSTRFAIQPGGGITVYLTEGVGVRVEGDYRNIMDTGDDYVFHEFRFLSGFTFQWGSR